MEFFINKNSTLPILKLELIDDGRNDFRHFYEKIQNANITFSMYDVTTGVKKLCRPAVLELITPPSCVIDRYYITYQFTSKDTAIAGRYVGKMNIDFLDGSGTLIAPIKEELFINVLDGSIKK